MLSASADEAVVDGGDNVAPSSSSSTRSSRTPRDPPTSVEEEEEDGCDAPTTTRRRDSNFSRLTDPTTKFSQRRRQRDHHFNNQGQHKHWPKHKIPSVGVAELRDAALFKDPPPKEDCPICFLPMPARLISCASLPNATRSSVPIYDYAKANEELATMSTEIYYTCCGKHVCRGCIHSFFKSGNDEKCPFCNAERKRNATDEDKVAEIRKRVDANDAASIFLLASHYYHGVKGLHQDQAKAIELWNRAAELGNTKAHNNLAVVYKQMGDLKKAKFHNEAAAMAGNEVARYNLGLMEANSGNIEQAVKHWTIGASAGYCRAMDELITCFKQRDVGRKSIGSTLNAYNKSCVEMRSEARDAFIRGYIRNN